MVKGRTHPARLTPQDGSQATGSASKCLSCTALHATLTTLAATWRAEGARCDTFHATMGIGWKACATELEALTAGSAATA